MFCFYNQMSPATLRHKKVPIYLETNHGEHLESKNKVGRHIIKACGMLPTGLSSGECDDTNDENAAYVDLLFRLFKLFSAFQTVFSPNLANVRKYGLICSSFLFTLSYMENFHDLY